MKRDTFGQLALTIALVCVLVLVATLATLAMPSIRLVLGFAPAQAGAYALGERIDVPPAVYESSQYTVVVFARSGCGVCQQMKPWLSDLAERVQQRASSRVVMVVGAGQLKDEIAFAGEIGLGRERVVPLTPGPIKVQVVPTVVLVDRQGRVLFVQEGAPLAERDAVIDRIVTLTQPH